MIVKPQKVKMTWNNRTKDYYLERGYTYTKNNDVFDCDINDLPNGCNKKVEIICDVCGKNRNQSYVSAIKSNKHYCSKECRKNNNKWDKEYLIKEFNRFKVLNGRYPNCEEMQVQSGFPSYYYYLKIWGSWSSFIKEMDIYDGRWLKEDLKILEDIYENESQEKIMSSLSNDFTWEHVKHKANELGLKRKYRAESKKKLSKEFLIDEFWRFYNEFGRYPFRKELNNSIGYPSDIGYIRLWGNWNDFLKEIGVIRKDCTDGWYICDENVLCENYETGTHEEIINQLMIKRKWGQIKHKASNLGLSRNLSLVKRKMSDEFLLQEVKRYFNKYSIVPTHNDFENDKDFPSATVIKKRFGTWNNALELCELNLNQVMKHSKEEIITELQHFYNEHKRSPFYNELKYSSPVIRNYWDSWDDMLQDCNLPPTYRSYGIFAKNKNNEHFNSKSEAIISNIFIDNNIKYEYETPYSKVMDIKNNYKFDFYLPKYNIYIEYFGMNTNRDREEVYLYKLKTEEKIKLCEENNVKLISLFPSDVRNNFVRVKNKFLKYDINLKIDVNSINKITLNDNTNLAI